MHPYLLLLFSVLGVALVGCGFGTSYKGGRSRRDLDRLGGLHLGYIYWLVFTGFDLLKPNVVLAAIG